MRVMEVAFNAKGDDVRPYHCLPLSHPLHYMHQETTRFRRMRQKSSRVDEADPGDRLVTQEKNLHSSISRDV